MANQKNQPPQAELNLGLSSLLSELEAISVAKPKPIVSAERTNTINQSLLWIERELESGVLPKALIADRVISVAKEHYRALINIDPDSPIAKRIDQSATNVFSKIDPQIVAELKASFEQAKKNETKEAPQIQEPPAKRWVDQKVEPTEKTPTRPSSTTGSSTKVWEQYAERVREEKTSAIAAIAGGMSQPTKESVASLHNSRTKAYATLSVIALFAVFASLFFGSDVDSSQPIKFVRNSPKLLVEKIAEDPLQMPKAELLTQVSSLSSLVYEFKAQPSASAASAAVRPVRMQNNPAPVANLPATVSEPAPVQAAPVEPPKIMVKEALNIGESNEPQIVRDIQTQPEPALKENTFEFPPFINKAQPTPSSNVTYTRVDVDGYPVVHFDTPRKYSITAATQIMSRPSYWAPKLGVHDPGDLVTVDAIIGVWLRIRDEFDNPGYILAQDAAPESSYIR